MAIKWLAKTKCPPIHVAPGDTITAIVQGGPRVTTPITKQHTVTDIGVGEVTNELGFVDGVLAIFGKAKKGG